MMLHTYFPQLISPKSRINILHLTVSDIQPGQAFSHWQTVIDENNTCTALKGRGVKMGKNLQLVLPWQQMLPDAG